MEIKVECDEGAQGGGEPRAFSLGKQRIEIVSVVDRWFGEDYCYFKVDASDGAVYILRHDEQRDTWEMTWFNARG